MKKREITSEHEVTAAKKKKCRLGTIEAVTWYKKLEVDTYEYETKINWSALARKYKITNMQGQVAKNGGQIAQEWLISEGVNLHQFKRPSTADRQPRRRKLKGLGGEISLPTPETTDKIKERLQRKILKGKLRLGRSQFHGR